MVLVRILEGLQLVILPGAKARSKNRLAAADRLMGLENKIK